MEKLIIVQLFTLCVSCGFSLSVMANTLAEYMPGEILVKYKESTPVSSMNALVAGISTRLKATRRVELLQQIVLERGEDIQQQIKLLKQDENVEYAQPNYIYRKAAIPDDPSYGVLWGLNNTGQPVNSVSGTPGKDISAEDAWELVADGDCSSVTVAVVDSGVNLTHEDLNVVGGYDFIDNDASPLDDDGHGTHVAGIIGTVGNNATGTTGVCWSVNIMPIRVLDAVGVGTTLTVYQGIIRAITDGADIINMSLGISGIDDPLIKSAIDSTTDPANDIVVVTAAGNEGPNDNDINTAYYPCNYTNANIICVAALDQDYGLASFSNTGAISVDVGAPGVNILSAEAGIKTTVFVDPFNDENPAWESYPGVINGGGPDDWIISSGYLSDPSGYDISNDYANNVDQTAFFTINLSGYTDNDIATFEHYTDVSLGSGDTIDIVYGIDGVNPPTTSMYQFDTTYPGSGFFSFFGHELDPSCFVNTCRLGFRLRSDFIDSSYGIDVSQVQVNRLSRSNSHYDYKSGTSMATPHVSGIAALVKAFHPNYVAEDIVNAVKFSGDNEAALALTTSTGKAVDAYNALIYINPPRGLSVEPGMPIVQ